MAWLVVWYLGFWLDRLAGVTRWKAWSFGAWLAGLLDGLLGAWFAGWLTAWA